MRRILMTKWPTWRLLKSREKHPESPEAFEYLSIEKMSEVSMEQVFTDSLM